MRNFKSLLTAAAVSLVMVTGCKEDFRTDNGVAPQDWQSSTLTGKSARTSADLEEKLAKLRASLPAGFEENLKQNTALLLKAHPQYRSLVLQTLAVESTACNDDTQINRWLDQELADWNRTLITHVLTTAMLDVPTYDALVFENSSANQSFGPNGEYTQKLTKAFKDLQRFWNIDSENIVLAAMHGTMLGDRDKLIRTYRVAYGLNAASAAYYADYVLAVLDAYPQLRNGNHPIFTFNAFAMQGFYFPPVGQIADKIIMGDGIMEGFAAIGFADVAPQAILAHEFGHQIQFQLQLFGEEESPEATRRTELMADAYSAYYLSHARGASMQWKRVQQFLQVFFNIGDCGVTSDGHHGTPTQRLAAAEWGYQLANDAQKQGHILTAEEFAQLFDAQLPTLIAR